MTMKFQEDVQLRTVIIKKFKCRSMLAGANFWKKKNSRVGGDLRLREAHVALL